MSSLPLTLGCGLYDRTIPLLDGRVRIEGAELRYIPLCTEELFFRIFHHHEFDLTEMSLSAYMMARSKGPWVYDAVPVYLSRIFRHSAIFVRTGAGIREPKDLRGKRIGVPEYTQTAGVTARGVLEEEYGVKPAEIAWFNGGLEQPGRREKFPLTLSPGVVVETAAEKSLSQMLLDGELDGLISAVNPSCFTPGGPVVRLFPNYRELERAYFAKTGVFPIMHVLGIRRSLVEAHPWLPTSVVKAFNEAKALVMRDIDGGGGLNVATVPWLSHEVEAARALMGEDYWPYGIARNRPSLEAAARWSHQQGLTPRPMSPEEMFLPSTHEEYKV